MKKLLVLILVLMMALASVSLAAAENAPKVTVESTIFGTAFVDGFSTLKAYTDKELTVPGEPVTYTGEAVISIAFEDGTAVDDAKIDLSGAKVAIVDGDAYYAVSAAKFEDVIIAAVGSQVEITFNETDARIIPVTSFKLK